MALDPGTGYVVTNKTGSWVTQCHRPLPTEAVQKNVSLPVLAGKFPVQTAGSNAVHNKDLLTV